MSKNETRKYAIELVSTFRNLLLWLFVFFGFIFLAISIHHYFVIPLGIFLLMIGIWPKPFIFFKEKKTIYLHSQSLEVVETGKKVDFQKVKWFRTDRHSRSPFITFVLKEEGKFWPESFAIIEGSASMPSWKGFKNTCIRRIKKCNPNSKSYWETTQGKVIQYTFTVFFLLSLLYLMYQKPLLIVGIMLFLIILVISIFRK